MIIAAFNMITLADEMQIPYITKIRLPTALIARIKIFFLTSVDLNMAENNTMTDANIPIISKFIVKL